MVRADNRVSLRSVEVGPRVDSMWVIKSGLEPGERVITEGLAKAADGAVVAPKAAAVADAPGPGKGI